MNKTLLLSLALLPGASTNAYSVDLIGKTTGIDPVNVVSEVSGVLKQIHWYTGDTITYGAPLALINPIDFQLEVRKQKANVSLVEADLSIKRSLYKRYVKLRGKNSLSQNELDIAKADFDAAKAQLSLAKIELEKAQLDLDSTSIHSSIEGYVVSRPIETGAWVNQGDLLYQLINIDQLNVRLLASEFDLASLHVGQPIQLWSESNQNNKILASIKRIGVELDPSTYAYPVEVSIDNAEHQFKPGMSIHATTTFENNQ